MNTSLKELPWVEPFLKGIHIEYAQPPPFHKLVEPTKESYAYVYSLAEASDPFDTAHLKRECGKALRRKQATLFRSVASQGEMFVVSLHASPI